MKIVNYNFRYKKEILELWNSSMVADPLSEGEFLKKIILDDNFDPEYTLIAIEKDKVVGFIWAILRKVPYGDRGLEAERGWIPGICVDKHHRRKGIATELVKIVEDKFIRKGIKNITLGAYSPNYLFPGVDKNNYESATGFFEKLDYIKFSEAASMERSLFDFRKSEKYEELKAEVIKKGFKLSTFKLKDSEELLEFLHKNFDGGWARNVKQAIINNRAEDTILVMRDREKNIVGYCQRAIDGNSDRFGPFGVKEELRGLRLGMVLFNEMLFDMLSRGITHTYFLWTSGYAQKFYEKNGMNVYREYNLMKKNIK